LPSSPTSSPSGGAARDLDPAGRITGITIAPDERYCVACYANGVVRMFLLPEASLRANFPAYVAGLQQTAHVLGTGLWSDEKDEKSPKRSRGDSQSTQTSTKFSPQRAGSLPARDSHVPMEKEAVRGNRSQTFGESVRSFFSFRKK
jgi:hypothetical protein